MPGSAPIRKEDIEASYRYCARLTRSTARNFYYAFWLLPPARRRSIYAIYAFSRRLDDIVDGVDGGATDAGVPEGDATDSLARLQYMRSLLDAGVPTADPLAPALRDTVATYSIPIEHFDELIAGMTMDLHEREYQTFDDLRLYCYRAASTIGLISIEVFGHQGDGDDVREIHDSAIELGLAMQLTNIVRDVPEDLDRGRLYLPAEELRRFDVSSERLRRGEMDDSVRALMEFQVARARRYFRQSERLFPHIDRSSRYCPVLLKDLYSSILDRIERARYDVFSSRPGLSRVEKLRLLARLWLRAKLRG